MEENVAHTIEVNDDWKELMGTEIMMKVIGTQNPSCGEKESVKIEPADAVLINFEARIANDREKTGLLFQQVKGWLIVVGDSDVLPALEMGVRFMAVGQTALNVPPKSNVMYKVTVSQKVMDTSRLNPYFTIQKALTKKKIANDIYENEYCCPPETSDEADCSHAMKRAIRLYTNAAKDMEILMQSTYFKNVEKDHPQRHECRNILVDSLNNIVAVYLRQKEYHEAKLCAVQVLTVDSNNVKALLRAAKAALLDPASTLEEASVATKAAESVIAVYSKNKSHDEKELRRLKNRLKIKKLNYKEKYKEMFGNKLSLPTPVPKKDIDSTMLDKLTPTGKEKEIGNKYFWLLQIIPIIFFLYRHFYWNMDQTDKT
eukprot:CAMPEP_0170918248 /NCGR_PEP_ID=MMETSP0735-20130129/7869_1 /TAXON_ID=186038 /ORGANISM="Fragilariopsis kerguelensis, Strain L26-C5" /LENGTH=371 /DNA_ID=CAMNT_0011316689 /DNA_START=81 /DNA_END=1197 /DNA_ORIENTATION=+